MEESEKEAAAKRGRNAAGYEVSSACYTTIPMPFQTPAAGYTFSVEQFRTWMKDPRTFIRPIRELGRWLYYVSGEVQTAVEYMRTMHLLEGVAVCKSRNAGEKEHAHFPTNRKKMMATLRSIRIKEAIRDALLRECVEGMQVSYLEVRESGDTGTKFLTDADIQGITEINEAGMSASIIALPVDYCALVGRRNGVPVVAFDLRYFAAMTPQERERVLAGMPREIQAGYAAMSKPGGGAHNWIVLDPEATICTKICAEMKQPYGIPFVVKATEDVLYAKKYMDAKSSVLEDVSTEIFYHILPGSGQKGLCSLTDKQQKEQHQAFTAAVKDDKTRGGRRALTVATGTELGKLDVDTDLLGENADKSVTTSVPRSLGLSATILSGGGGDTYAAAALNAEFVSAYVYAWIGDYMTELNKAINAKIIRDRRCVVDYEILPVTHVNKAKAFESMRQMYMECSGSLSAVIAASGMSVDAYMSLMEWERAQKIDERYPPHRTSYTATAQGDTGGRPSVDSTEPSTMKTRENGGNDSPKPSV